VKFELVEAQKACLSLPRLRGSPVAGELHLCTPSTRTQAPQAAGEAQNWGRLTHRARFGKDNVHCQ
jgi:hypothetical protein